MWWLAIQRNGSRQGFRIVRYSLLTLIIFMLVCTLLAIILVLFASDYSASLHDRTQGIILILLLIAFNYTMGLIAVWRCHLLALTCFALFDIALSVVCLLSTSHQRQQSLSLPPPPPPQGHHLGNLGALLIFAASAALSCIFVWQTCAQRASHAASSVQNASVNCYHHISDDWHDCGSGSNGSAANIIARAATTVARLPMTAGAPNLESYVRSYEKRDRDELIIPNATTNQHSLPLPYNACCPCESVGNHHHHHHENDDYDDHDDRDEEDEDEDEDDNDDDDYREHLIAEQMIRKGHHHHHHHHHQHRNRNRRTNCINATSTTTFCTVESNEQQFLHGKRYAF